MRRSKTAATEDLPVPLLRLATASVHEARMAHSNSFVRARIVAVVLTLVTGSSLFGQTPSPAPAGSPSLEQRVADLEAYVNNAGRGSDAQNAAVSSAIPGPGPGHNGWMMTCSALVLFMTLP